MSTEEDACKLFVAGLPDSMTEDVLRQLFEATGGTIKALSLPRDRMTGRPRGFGFVTLSTAEEAAAARASLDGSLQAGRSISVRPFQSEAPRRGEGAPPTSGGGGGGGGGGAGAPDRTLYVGNLPYDATPDDVQTLFSESGAGQAARVHLPVGPDGRLRGFGFVTMPSAEAANAAIVALRSVEMGGRRLIVNIAHPKGERPERSERPHMRPREEGSMQSRPSARPANPDAMTLEGMGEPPRAPEGRRRAVKPERSDSDKKRKAQKRGAASTEKPPARRGRKDSWENWEDWDDD